MDYSSNLAMFRNKKKLLGSRKFKISSILRNLISKFLSNSSSHSNSNNNNNYLNSSLSNKILM